MDSTEREELHKALTEQCRTNPERMADLIVDLMDKVEQLTARVEQLEDQLKKKQRQQFEAAEHGHGFAG